MALSGEIEEIEMQSFNNDEHSEEDTEKLIVKRSEELLSEGNC